MKNIIILSIVVAFVLSGCSPIINKNAQPDPGFHIISALTFEPRVASPPIKSIKNVPESIRNVEIPSGDWGYEGPIPDDSARGPWMTEIKIARAGIKYIFENDIQWDTYLNVSWNIGHWINVGGELNERNYHDSKGGDSRGYGAALTYWNVSYDRWIPGIATEILFDRNKADVNFEKWLIGAEFRRYDAQITTGTDTYNKLQHKHHYDIGTISEESFYVGLSDPPSKNSNYFMDIKTGINLYQFNQDDNRKEIDVEMNDFGFFISYTIGFLF